MKGTYTLLTRLGRGLKIEVGALGPLDFPVGWYAYTGSAFGSGGFARIDRHRRVAAGEHDVRFWHVDYLLGHPAAQLVSVGKSPSVDVECAVARALPGDPVPGFGASDCGCESHLVYAAERTVLADAIDRAHAGRV